MIKDEGKVVLQNKFIDLRAKGFSYSKIAKELNVSKGTLTAWNRDLGAEIAEYKAIQLDELYEEYFMLKESRIKKLGDTLKKLDEEIQDRDFKDLPTEKLLDYQIKFIKELKIEFVGPSEDDIDTNMNDIAKVSSKLVLQEMFQLFLRHKRGDIASEQVQKEISLLMALLKSYETSTLENKVDSLREAIGN